MQFPGPETYRFQLGSRVYLYLLLSSCHPRHSSVGLPLLPTVNGGPPNVSILGNGNCLVSLFSPKES